MKVLFIGSGCTCRLPFVEHLLKKKLQEANISDVEVKSAYIAEWGVTHDESAENSGPDKEGELLKQADYIVVTEERQRNLLTRFLDYSCWHKIHLFLDYCVSRKDPLKDSGCGELNYLTQDERVSAGCIRLIKDIRHFLKGHLVENNVWMPA